VYTPSQRRFGVVQFGSLSDTSVGAAGMGGVKFSGHHASELAFADDKKLRKSVVTRAITAIRIVFIPLT
jgi:hypothetical protein